ncbi:CopD family protein [Aestuariirhabdus sp. LZHN29]|uniref:CopD family protein n=1 Tax=Aestuariirhabdus sp. LZHN29 TaxID=3417462 RepID=UPI003CE9E6AA
MGILLALHLLAAVIWVGGMFFAYIVLRPVVADELEPPARLRVWRGVFSRFFRWVWGALAVLWVSGLAMVFGVFGSFAYVGHHVHLMVALAVAMTLVFAGLYLRSWPALTTAVDAQAWPQAGAALNGIRRLVAVNLVLGLTVTAVASGGRYLMQ